MNIRVNLRILIIFASITFCIINLSAQSDDEKSIKATALNYIEGWYSADTSRMVKALSPELKKSGFLVNDETNQVVIREASYSQMIKWTGARSNVLKENPELKIEVKILEIGKNIATVKTVTPDFIDYIHLGKLNGEWKIYNVVWEPNNRF